MSSTEVPDASSEKVLFPDLQADDDPEVTEIESLCLQCGENGITKLLLTKIPFYKEVVLMSFSCDNCHWENNELKPASIIQEKGVTFELKVKNSNDLARTVVKTDWASITIPELEFEIPSQSQEGTVTNIEGILERACTGIGSKMEYLKVEDPESALKVAEFLGDIAMLKSGTRPFTFVLRDCSGNSFLENLCAPAEDPQLDTYHFERSREENIMLGLYSPDDGSEDKPSNTGENLRDEVLGIATNCYSCNAPCVTNMKLIQIPHFKDVVIICTVCDVCGHKTNEVKSGGGIEPLGTRATLNIQELQDLKRDVLKSDTCRIFIKELEVEVGPGAFGGRYSTVEGILSTIKEQLKESNPFITGDSADLIRKERMTSLLQKIDEVIAGQRKVTFVLDDPCGNSYLQSIDYPNPENNLVVEKYERTLEQDEELGVLDMKVEGYEEDS